MGKSETGGEAVNAKLCQQLFHDGYAHTHMAADGLSAVADAELERAKITEVLRHLQHATAAVQSLERLLAGNPEPRTGE